MVEYKAYTKEKRAMSMVSTEHLYKEFGRIMAVKDVSFEVELSEIVGFLGPNGAGKTTTMKMLTGYLPPTAGTARIAGHDIIDEPLEARRHMGYMPENVPLYDDMRVYEYLYYRAKLKGLFGKSVRQQVGYVMDRCGLDSKRKSMIHTEGLSSTRWISGCPPRRTGIAHTGRTDQWIGSEPDTPDTRTHTLFSGRTHGHPFHPHIKRSGNDLQQSDNH